MKFEKTADNPRAFEKTCEKKQKKNKEETTTKKLESKNTARQLCNFEERVNLRGLDKSQEDSIKLERT